MINMTRDFLMVCLPVLTRFSSNPAYALRLTAEIKYPNGEVLNTEHRLASAFDSNSSAGCKPDACVTVRLIRPRDVAYRSKLKSRVRQDNIWLCAYWLDAVMLSPFTVLVYLATVRCCRRDSRYKIAHVWWCLNIAKIG
ncbi:hypothetical protein DE146DRAFT_333087 [Phaeosphaeria sp. MPI-PUGE-AT-0046c]|nr:hypothetical protein DE146DRAFT_333087 [Phaeosphaeria sp. MPI-PUGE-AT-0046c]